MNDQCVYIHPRRQILVGVYVDDLVICGKLIQDVEKVKQSLALHFPIKDLGLIDTIIGWKITRDRLTRSLKISQAHYINDTVESFGLDKVKTYTSPLDGYSGILPAGQDEQLADDSAYLSAIGSLGYASNSTRPDISFAVSQLASFNSSPVQRHWNSVCRVFRYLKGTENYCINYSFGPVSDEFSSALKLQLFSDSDYASDITSRRSVSGYILMVGGGPVSWQSKRQKSVATSTMEAEYVALFEASKHAVWVTRFLKDLHVSDQLIDDNGLRTFTDNQSALALARGTNSARTKHIDVAYHFTRECVTNGDIAVEYIPTNHMIADVLTKPLTRSKAEHLYRRIFGLDQTTTGIHLVGQEEC